MQRSTDRIRTTHVGSLARPAPLLDLMKAAAAGNPAGPDERAEAESVKPPDGAVLLPGVISHATNIVEHPDTIADRITRFAELAGRENVVASADCGFSSQALYRTEVHDTVVWEKFKAMRQGADLATKMLWK
jgi:5-methyltetrahydropteroyltriglutamate--homocysteine methyltransferase